MVPVAPSTTQYYSDLQAGLGAIWHIAEVPANGKEWALRTSCTAIRRLLIVNIEIRETFASFELRCTKKLSVCNMAEHLFFLEN